MLFQVETDKALKLDAEQPSRPSRERPVFIADDWFDEIVRMIKEYTGDHMAAVVVDEEVARLYPERLQALYDAVPRMRTIKFKGGESAKTLERYAELQGFLLEQEVHRDDSLISIGGGTFCDLVGFVAATFARGVSWISIPTTFIAQFDCALGGKTAVNVQGYKNYCGTFYWPNVVFVDRSFLRTLPDRYFRMGIPELAKLAMIGDEQLFRELCEATAGGRGVDGLRDNLEDFMVRAMKVKLSVSTRDPFQRALRVVLLAGHTNAHALEGASRLHLHHGEAVAIGLAFESFIAVKQGLLDADDRVALIDLLENCQLPTVLPAELHDRVVVEHMRLEKRNRGRMLSLVLPYKPGQAVDDWPASRVMMPPDDLWGELTAYRLTCG